MGKLHCCISILVADILNSINRFTMEKQTLMMLVVLLSASLLLCQVEAANYKYCELDLWAKQNEVCLMYGKKRSLPDTMTVAEREAKSLLDRNRRASLTEECCNEGCHVNEIKKTC